jgi:hypothetical protein
MKFKYNEDVKKISADYEPTRSAVYDYKELARKYYGGTVDKDINNVIYNSKPDSKSVASVNEINSKYPDLAAAYKHLQKEQTNFIAKHSATTESDAIMKAQEMAVRQVDNLPREVLDNVAKERAREFAAAIDNDPTLEQMANNFTGLTLEQKTEFGQKLINRASESNAGINGYTFRVISRNEIPPKISKTVKGWHDNTIREIVFVADNNQPDFMNFIKTLAHEDAHKLDYINPNFGALGSQRANFGKTIYRINPDVYRKNWTEQSSFFIGDYVKDAIIK